MVASEVSLTPPDSSSASVAALFFPLTSLLVRGSVLTPRGELSAWGAEHLCPSLEEFSTMLW